MHSLILGMTESGKTTLAKKLAQTYIDAGKHVIVLDPMQDPGFPASFKTHDPDLFLEVFFDNKSCYVFIDESGDMIGRYNSPMLITATKGRHWGHSVHYITQRGAQLNATIRDQCTNLFLFTSGLRDRKLLAEEFNDLELKNELDQFEFYQVSRTKKAIKRDISTTFN